MTEYQKQAVAQAIDYIVTVTDKQKRLLPCESLYGDGTRWTALTRKGFEAVYNSVKETLVEKNILVEA